MTQRIDKTILVKAPPSAVWRALTTPELMKQWMAEPEMQVEVVTDWRVGHPIIIKGFHHVQFENRGTVLQFELDNVLRYSHLSSLSRLPDEPASYTTIELRLTATSDNGTSLALSLSNFPTETILKHLEFYWAVTIGILKDFVEKKSFVG